jgi:hypothetical protein
MSRIAFPTDYDERACYLVAINASLIPYVAGALRFYEKRGSWLTQADYEQGYNAFAHLQACMMKCCIDDLIESNDRLYRMVDTALYGTEYSVDSTDPLVVSPAIEPTHALVIERPDSILGRMEDSRQLLQNALNGTDTPNYSDTPGIRELLANLITAVEAGGASDEDMLAQLVQIAGLLA